MLRNQGERRTINDIGINIEASGQTAYELRLSGPEVSFDAEDLAAPEQAAQGMADLERALGRIAVDRDEFPLSRR